MVEIEESLKIALRRARTTKIAFWLTLLSFIALILATWFEANRIKLRGGPVNETAVFLELLPFAALLAVGVSALTFVVSAFNTASSVILGWRDEARKRREFELKIEHLELQLAEARAKAEQTKVPQTPQV